jgi:hypothetical protein
VSQPYRYHNWLGFAAVIVYVRDDYLHDMVKHEMIRKGINERILIIVRWDGIPPFPSAEQIYDQVPESWKCKSMWCHQ